MTAPAPVRHLEPTQEAGRAFVRRGIVGEPVLMLWLLVRGVNVERWEARAVRVA